MKGPLTSQHLDRDSRASGVRMLARRLRRFLAFLLTAYRDQKLAELSSFIVWELFHRLGVFRSDSYLRFREENVLELAKADITTLHRAPDDFWASRGLAIRPASQDWKLVFDTGIDLIGTLADNPNVLCRSSDGGQTVETVCKFPAVVEAVVVTSRGVVLVCVRGAVYRSGGEGGAFQEVLQLSTPESYFRRPTGITELPTGILIIGEYGNVRRDGKWVSLANLYYSADQGESWERSDYLIRQGANKHVHFVWYSALLNVVLVADGDNKKRLWISDPIRRAGGGLPALNLTNRFHLQMGGHTAVAEVGGRLLLGTDYMGGTNFLLSTNDGRDFARQVVPDPYRQSPVMQLTIRVSRQGSEIWALLPYASSRSRSLLMYSRDAGRSWSRLIEYDESHGVQLVSSSTAPRETLFVSVSDRRRGVRKVYEIGDFDSGT